MSAQQPLWLTIPATPPAPPRPITPPQAPGAPQVPLAATAADSLQVTAEQARASVQWLADTLIDKLPRDYRGDKDWGDQKKMWAGVNVKLDGWKVKTHRRYRDRNHGRWIRYEATLPAGSNPAATVHRVDRHSEPASRRSRWMIESSVAMPMEFTAQIQRWNRGVKVYSLTIRGDLRVRMDSVASVDFVADYAEVPPALVIDPRIERAVLVMEHFEVDRVSKIGGDVAEEWGELMEDLFRDRLIDRQNEKLLTKLNAAIDKHRGELRISMAQWLAEW